MEGMAEGQAGIGGMAQAALGMSIPEAGKLVQVVSLGSYCGAKLTLRRLGLGEASMPFDWMRTSIHGLLHCLEHDFDGFLEWSTKLEVTQCQQRMTVYRSEVSSFWHDDLEDEVDREKLRRRVRRFDELAADPRRALLFVRSTAGSEEVKYSELLLDALQRRFQVGGCRVWLLIILEDQPLVGPILHARRPELLFWVQPRFTGKLSPYLDTPAPFEDAVVWAVQRLLGDPAGFYPRGQPGTHEQWPTVSSSAEILDPGEPLCRAGLHETSCGIWAGEVAINGLAGEVMLAAFDGFDGLVGQAPVPVTTYHTWPVACRHPVATH